MMALGLRLLSPTPFHAYTDDSVLFLATLAVSGSIFDEPDQKPNVRVRKYLSSSCHRKRVINVDAVVKAVSALH